MRILFFIDRLFAGGRQRRVVELLKALSPKEKYHLGIVTMRKEIHYKEIFKIKNLKIYIIERKHKKDISVFYKFYKIAKQFKPDIIHAWSSMSSLYAVPTKILLGAKLINNQITDAPEKIKNKFYEFLIPALFSDKIIANSYAGLNAYNAPWDKSLVIYNGFDFKRVESLPPKKSIINKLNITTPFIVGMVASFSKYKDYDTYLSAAKIILDIRKDVTFLAIGQGDYNKYKNAIESKYTNNIKFLGRQNNIESLMNICDIGVLATYTEGLPNAIMEFMALSKPVIVSDGGGTKELVIDGENGFLINAQEPELLAEKINILINDTNLAKAMGIRGQERIKNKFTIENMINSFENVYLQSLRK